MASIIKDFFGRKAPMQMCFEEKEKEKDSASLQKWEKTHCPLCQIEHGNSSYCDKCKADWFEEEKENEEEMEGDGNWCPNCFEWNGKLTHPPLPYCSEECVHEATYGKKKKKTKKTKTKNYIPS
jgi:hypothetical protein